MALNARTAANILGAVFIIVGILGFFPNPLVSPTGLFAVNAAHNLIHILSGAVILAFAHTGPGASLGLKIVGAVYALVAVLGLILHGDMLLGIVRVNGADHGCTSCWRSSSWPPASCCRTRSWRRSAAGH